MRESNKMLKKLVLPMMVLSMLFVPMNTNAATQGTKKINDKYGELTGKLTKYKSCGAKWILSTAETTKKVPRLMATGEVQYYTTGEEIIGFGTWWEVNTKQVGEEVDMIHFKNKQNHNKYDGFLNTKLTAYGCAEAIVKKSYTVYTSCTY